MELNRKFIEDMIREQSNMPLEENDAIRRFDACPKIFFGADALDYLLGLPKDKTIVITDPYMVKSGTVAEITSRLAQNRIEHVVFSEVEPDPSIETVAAGLQVIFREKPGTVIALGGGSAIDATKAMLYFCIRLKSGLMEKQYVRRPMFVAIPTTSGTGSEVTSYAVISDRRQGVKIPLRHRSMIPAVAILDPHFTRTLPADMVAYTGMDVLTHAIEAYVSPGGNDFTGMFAVEAAGITLRCLPALHRNAGDSDMREKMYSASTMAGLAFTNSGLGLCHGIAHTLGAQYHIPHGKANAVALPYVILFNAGLGPHRRSGVRARYAQMARKLGMRAADDTELCRMMVLTARILCEQFGIPTSLADCGVPEAAFYGDMAQNIDKILEDACTKANPLEVNREDLRALLDDIYRGVLTVFKK
ncbi:MAG: iron-containing alcohol dehydrogenase [Oscillospiraceae bacterium]|jgi:acetaldehyde dehydrogenase/alcohol dehydrogenase|nr:iron-containing alcohol dehydrogenase [Oscillospiraceae bacterium]